jgi:hypothetical protein
MNLKPDKKRSADKIDGMVCLLMAMARVTIDDTRPSVYESQGLTVI